MEAKSTCLRTLSYLNKEIIVLILQLNTKSIQDYMTQCVTIYLLPFFIWQ